MKHIVFAVILLILTTSGLFANRPKLDYQTHFLEVTDVVRQDSCLRISVLLKNMPGYWVSIPKNGTFLRPHNDTIGIYHLLGSENFELDKRIWMKKSGQHEGTLIFEKIPADVKVVDLFSIEENGDIETLALGIHLDEKDTTPPPAMFDAKTLFGSSSTGEWGGLDPSRYKDIPYYQENGKAHIKGKLYNYHPVAGFNTINVYTKNQITGARDKHTESLNPDGTFEFDLNVDYPQFSLFDIGE